MFDTTKNLYNLTYEAAKLTKFPIFDKPAIVPVRFPLPLLIVRLASIFVMTSNQVLWLRYKQKSNSDECETKFADHNKQLGIKTYTIFYKITNKIP